MKRALLVGIDEYDSLPPLGGCVNDVHAVEPLLARNEDDSPNFACESRTSASTRITRDRLLRDIEQLLGPGADVALLYFAGHGYGSYNDVSICTADGTEQTPGIELSKILGMAQESKVREVIVVLDCCFAGAAGGVPQLGEGIAAIRQGMSILAASRSDQTSAETLDGRGVFSTYLCGALDGGAAELLGKVTMSGLYSYLEESFGPWEQRPVLRANLDRLHEIRRCAPAVPISRLRRLRELFPRSDAQLPLDRSYEPTEEPHDEHHEADFSFLQTCRAAKLVEPVDAEHMYFAAMDDKACRLTALGRHYWTMIEKDLL